MLAKFHFKYYVSIVSYFYKVCLKNSLCGKVTVVIFFFLFYHHNILIENVVSLYI